MLSQVGTVVRVGSQCPLDQAFGLFQANAFFGKHVSKVVQGEMIFRAEGQKALKGPNRPLKVSGALVTSTQFEKDLKEEFRVIFRSPNQFLENRDRVIQDFSKPNVRPSSSRNLGR